MSRPRRLLAPLRRIGAQIALLTLLSMLVTAILVSLIAAALHGGNEARDAARTGMGAFLSVTRMLADSDPADRAAIVAGARRAFPALELRLTDTAPEAAVTPPPVLDFLRHELGDRFDVAPLAAAAGEEGERVSVAVAPGARLEARLPKPPMPPRILDIAGVTLFFGVTLLVVLPWAAWWVARPLARFARAAAEFELEAEHEPLPETGPDEVRLAARSFNAMRRRIADLVADRTRMLAAVGHDLRTPITRLRLRAEFLEAGDVRSALLRDIDHMHRLVEGALAFLKGGAPPAAPGIVDLTALVQTVADEFAELGGRVSFTGPDGRVMVRGRLDGLQRALENLIENALRYGGVADVTLAAGDGLAVVEIADDGPGIPPERQAEMLRPFVRGDESRRAGRDHDGGLGLGLSIAAAIVADHGGRLAFDRSGAGRFLVRLALPLA